MIYIYIYIYRNKDKVIKPKITKHNETELDKSKGSSILSNKTILNTDSKNFVIILNKYSNKINNYLFKK